MYVFDKYGLPNMLQTLANKDEPWSPVRAPYPGRIILMVRGKDGRGPFDTTSVIADIPGWYYDVDKQRFVEGQKKIQGYLESIGVVWVGFNRSYYKRVRKYDSYDINPTTKQWEVVAKETKPGEEHLFYFSTTMAIKTEEAPAEGMYPVIAKVVFNILLINPLKAESVAGKWEAQATAAVSEKVREYLGSKKIDDLQKEHDTNKSGEMVDYILAANGPDEGADTSDNKLSLVPAYGIKIQGPRIEELDFESGDPEMSKAKREKFIAEQNLLTAEVKRKQTKVEAEAERDNQTIKAEGLKALLRARGEGDPTGVYALTDAIEKTGLSALSIGQGGGIIPTIPIEQKK